VDEREDQIKELLFWQKENTRLEEQLKGINEKIHAAKQKMINQQAGIVEPAIVVQKVVVEEPEENRLMKKEVRAKQRELNKLRKQWYAFRGGVAGHSQEGSSGGPQAAVRMLLRKPPPTPPPPPTPSPEERDTPVGKESSSASTGSGKRQLVEGDGDGHGAGKHERRVSIMPGANRGRTSNAAWIPPKLSRKISGMFIDTEDKRLSAVGETPGSKQRRSGHGKFDSFNESDGEAMSEPQSPMSVGHAHGRSRSFHEHSGGDHSHSPKEHQSGRTPRRIPTRSQASFKKSAANEGEDTAVPDLVVIANQPFPAVDPEEDLEEQQQQAEELDSAEFKAEVQQVAKKLAIPAAGPSALAAAALKANLLQSPAPPSDQDSNHDANGEGEVTE